MAPVAAAKVEDIRDLHISSLELDSRSTSSLDLAAYLSSLPLKDREAITHPSPETLNLHRRSLLTDVSPSDLFQSLVARDPAPATNTPQIGGAVDPNNINMKVVQAVFALIGASFVLGSIWFFFWAKNGGFQWRKGDWDEYKSTVLRRKGPNGTTLSNATKSTILGGGSVVGDGYSDRHTDDNSTVITGTMTELSSSTAPIMKEKRESRRGRNKKETAKEQKIREAKEATWEGGHDNDVRAYRHEKVARVGGINRGSDALHYGTDYTDTDGSVMHSQRAGQIRPRQSNRQASPEKRERQSRRDFSCTAGADAAFSTTNSERAQSPSAHRMSHQNTEVPPPAPPPHTSRPPRYHSPSKQSTQQQQQRPRQNVPRAYHNEPRGYTQPSDFSDVQSQNTKSYHHPLPALNNTNTGAARGYRRDRRDSLDD